MVQKPSHVPGARNSTPASAPQSQSSILPKASPPPAQGEAMTPASPSIDQTRISASDAATRISPVKRLRAARSVERLRGW